MAGLPDLQPARKMLQGYADDDNIFDDRKQKTYRLESNGDFYFYYLRRYILSNRNAFGGGTMIEAKSEAGEMTRRAILEMGVRLWRVDPQYVTARRIAQELGLNHATVLYHFRHGETRLRDAVALYAVQQGESAVIVSLIAMKHKAVATMEEAQRLEHMALVARG